MNIKKQYKPLLKITQLANLFFLLLIFISCKTQSTLTNALIVSKGDKLNTSKNKKPDITLGDIPSVVIYKPTKMGLENSFLLQEQIKNLEKIIGKEQLISFPYIITNEASIRYNNQKGSYLVNNNIAKPKTGVIFSDGINEPSILPLHNTNFLEEFKDFYNIHSKRQLKQYIKRREKTVYKNYKKDYKTYYNKVLKVIKSKVTLQVNTTEKKQINATLLKHFDFVYGYNFNEDYFTKPYHKLYIKVTEGSWKGRKSKVILDDEGKRIYSDWLIYDGENFSQNYLSYNNNGLLKQIKKLNYREKLNSTSENILHLSWVTNTLLYAYLIKPEKASPYHSSDFDRISCTKLEFNSDYTLKSKEILNYNAKTGKRTPLNPSFKYKWEYKENPKTIIEKQYSGDLNHTVSTRVYEKNKLYEEIVTINKPNYFFYSKGITKNGISTSYNEKAERLPFNIKKNVNKKGFLISQDRFENEKLTEQIKYNYK